MNNQKGFANIILVILIVTILVSVFGYFAFIKKSEPIAQQPTILTITQGLSGKIHVRSGNCMPRSVSDNLFVLFFDLFRNSDNSNNCKSFSDTRMIYVLKPIIVKSMEGNYLKEKVDLIKQTVSDNNGFYQIELPPGTYSVFVEDNGKEYCNLFDGLGPQAGACRAIVANGITEYNIQINHATD